MKTFWMSFVDDTGFLGVVVTRSEDFKSAVEKTWKLKVNPGGEIASWEADEMPEIKSEHYDVLLSKEDLVKEGYAVG